MSDVITMDREMLTEVMAQAMMIATQQRFGLPSRAAGEQSNITNRTEHYGLPLPTGNEVIAYQDIINDANNIIDGALHTLQNTLDTVSTTANNAANGVAAADTKINELVQANLDNESASLPQFKKVTVDRLDNLESDVNGLSGWTGGWLDAVGGTGTNTVLTSSIGVWFSGTTGKNYTAMTESMRHFLSNGVISTDQLKKRELCKKGGNVFNLPNLNTYYVITQAAFWLGEQGAIQLGTEYLGVKWTGTETVFAAISNALDNKNRTIPCTFLPMRPMAPMVTTEQ